MNKAKDTQTTRNTLCDAKIDILIKKNNRNTRKNDTFLQRDPPLCAKISLYQNHNHSLNTSGSIKFLRVTHEVINIYLNFKYIHNILYIFHIYSLGRYYK